MTLDFVGREWLFDSILKFLNSSTGRNHPSRRILAITGSDGCGKTRICQEIQHPQVLTIEKSLVNKRCLTTIYLNPSSQTPAQAFTQLRYELNRTIFNNYAREYSLNSSDDLLSCLDRLNHHQQPLEHHNFILIDNFNTLGRAHTDEFMSIAKHLPVWIKLVVTSSEPSWLRRLTGLELISLDKDPRSRQDIELFTHNQLLASKPNFLAAQHTLHLIQHEIIQIDEIRRIRPGLNGLYKFLYNKLSLILDRKRLRLARFILALLALNPNRTLDFEYILRRVRFERNGALMRDPSVVETVFRVVSGLFFDKNSRLIHLSLKKWLESRIDFTLAASCETLVYWTRLCRLGSLMKTSTPRIPLVDIEFIDDGEEDEDEDLQSKSSYLFNLSRFRWFYSMIDESRRVGEEMDEIFERFCGVGREFLGDESIWDDDLTMTEIDKTWLSTMGSEISDRFSSTTTTTTTTTRKSWSHCFLKYICCWPF